MALVRQQQDCPNYVSLSVSLLQWYLSWEMEDEDQVERLEEIENQVEQLDVTTMRTKRPGM